METNLCAAFAIHSSFVIYVCMCMPFNGNCVQHKIIITIHVGHNAFCVSNVVRQVGFNRMKRRRNTHLLRNEILFIFKFLFI